MRRHAWHLFVVACLAACAGTGTGVEPDGGDATVPDTTLDGTDVEAPDAADDPALDADADEDAHGAVDVGAAPDGGSDAGGVGDARDGTLDASDADGLGPDPGLADAPDRDGSDGAEGVDATVNVAGDAAPADTNDAGGDDGDAGVEGDAPASDVAADSDTPPTDGVGSDIGPAAPGTPFEGVPGLVDPVDLPPETWEDGSVIDGAVHTRDNPYTGGDVSVTGTVGWDPAGPAALFIHVDELTFEPGGELTASGTGGVDAVFNRGGWGGSGGSGGGGGARYSTPGFNFTNTRLEQGGDGGTGAQGGDPTNTPGTGGLGSGLGYTDGFEYGVGGDGGMSGHVGGAQSCPWAGRQGGLGGGGGDGFGGGGGGGGSFNHSEVVRASGGGGGGGGGLVVVVANRIAGPGRVSAVGGRGGRPTGELNVFKCGEGRIWGGGGGGGGGGVVWIATGSYDGGLTAAVDGGPITCTNPYCDDAGPTRVPDSGGTGTARIFQRLPDGTLVERAFDETW